MKKIGIITLNGYENYGNRLQNYALQEVLKNYGYSVDTIVFEEIVKDKEQNKLLKLKSKSIKELITSFKLRTINRSTYNSIKIRLEIFKEFTNKYINEVKYFVVDKKKLHTNFEFNYKYDYFIVGSDQVWNPNFIDNEDIYFLRFTEKDKRISYAASFGISELPLMYKNMYKNVLKDMKYISVREEDGARITKELINTNVSVHVDPTLLLSKEQWLKVAVKAKNKPQNRYLLTYFLGGIPDTYNKQIQDLARNNSLEIINLGEILEKDTYRTGPGEFLDYICDSSIFCTDSFHGAVFSILFERPFIVYPRQGSISMYSRINTLLDKFNLNHRKIENVKLDKEIMKVDFSETAKILQKERKKSDNYFKKALGSEDDK